MGTITNEDEINSVTFIIRSTLVILHKKKETQITQPFTLVYLTFHHLMHFE